MGCINSQPSKEDVVSKFRARKRFMKQAVLQRHAFALAHCAYLQALRNAGSALRQFAEGESKDSGTPRSTLSSQYGSLLEPPPPPPLLMKRSSSFPSVGTSSALVNSSSPNLSSSQRKDENWAPSGSEPNDTPPPPSPQKSTWDFFNPFRPSTPPFQGRSKMKAPNNRNVNSYYNQEAIPDLEEEYERHNAFVDWERKSGDVSVGRIGGKDLLEIVKELDDRFLRASSGGTDVSKVMETRKGHFVNDSNEARKNGAFQSTKKLSALTWNWAKNPLATVEDADMNENTDSTRSHALTLERLFAWEKKLFEEVKAGEQLRSEHQKKCALLRSQETKGDDSNAVDKTRATIKRLHSLILVSFQGVDSTTAAVKRLRDDELFPQLVELVQGLMYMWRTMHECHVHQKQIVLQFKNLDSLVAQDATSDYHHHATVELEKELSNWYESFCKLVSSHREYMTALNGWSRLSLMEIEMESEENESTEGMKQQPQEAPTPKIYNLCEEWQMALDRLPDKVASEAIKSLVAVVHALVVQQTEEQKQKRKVERLTKRLQRKVADLQNAERKQTEAPQAIEPLGTNAKRLKRKEWEEETDEEASMTSDTDEDFSAISTLAMAVKDPLTEKKADVELLKKKLQDERQKHAKSVQDTRILTMNNLQTGLPGVFEAMTGFSAVCAQAFQALSAQADTSTEF